MTFVLGYLTRRSKEIAGITDEPEQAIEETVDHFGSTFDDIKDYSPEIWKYILEKGYEMPTQGIIADARRNLENLIDVDDDIIGVGGGM